MRIIVNPESRQSSNPELPPKRLELLIEHAGATTLSWGVAAFSSAKKTFLEELDVTEHINAYWMQLPLPRQQKIFDVYSRIYGVFQRYFKTIELSVQLRPLIEELYRYHQLEDIENWLNYKLDVSIYIPSRYAEEFIYDPGRPMTREKTYTRSDYKHLVALAIALRPMIPIWGEFIDRTSKETGTAYKELYAYLLLTDTKLDASKAMEKLSTYIKSHVKGDVKAQNSNMIVEGLSSEDYERWVLGALLVNRICVGDVRGSETAPCLVVSTHKYVTARIVGTNGAAGTVFGEQIRDKDFRTGGNEEQEISPIEAYKIRQKRPTGAIAPFEYFLHNPEAVARLVFPDVDLTLLHRLLGHTEQLVGEKLWPCQITMAQIVIARAMSPRAMMDLDKVHTLRAIAIAQTVLWQRGHLKLAALITCTASDNEDQQQISSMGIGRLPEEIQRAIFELYPYQRYTAKREKTKPPHNPILAIDNLAKQFSMRDWVLMLPDDLTHRLVGNTLSRRYPCPYDIRTALGRLTIEVAKRELSKPLQENQLNAANVR